MWNCDWCPALESTSWTNMQYYLSHIPWWLAGMHYLSHEIKYCKKQELSIVSPIIRPNSGLAYHPPYSLEAISGVIQFPLPPPLCQWTELGNWVYIPSWRRHRCVSHCPTFTRKLLVVEGVAELPPHESAIEQYESAPTFGRVTLVGPNRKLNMYTLPAFMLCLNRNIFKMLLKRVK